MSLPFPVGSLGLVMLCVAECKCPFPCQLAVYTLQCYGLLKASADPHDTLSC